MKLSSNNYKLDDFYEILDYPSLSFKDKLLKFMGNKDLSIKPSVFDNEIINEFYDLILKIKEENLKTIIISDYDSDGICSLVMMLRLLERLDIKANYYVPSRSKEGYGISLKIVDMIIENGFDVVITLDNGVIAYEQMDKLSKHKIKRVVIDHHIYEKEVDALIIHPKKLDDYYSGLCTSGLVYYISKHYYFDDYLASLALVGSLGDMVEVLKANREILIDNLSYFNKSDNVVKALLGEGNNYDYEDISFKLVPKLNAISRLDPIYNINLIIRYFKDNKYDEATQQKILSINDLRKQFTDTMYQKAKEMVDDSSIGLIYSDTFKEGLCGIVAARLANESHKPMIVLSKKGDNLVGSCRSVEGFDMHQAIKDFPYVSFGGHKMACGLSIKEDDVEAYRDFLKTKEVSFDKKALLKLNTKDINLENIKILDSLKPFGTNFSKPKFYLEVKELKSVFMIKGLYPKYRLNDNVEAIGFNQNLYQRKPLGFIGSMRLNEYGGKTKVDFIIEDVTY